MVHYIVYLEEARGSRVEKQGRTTRMLNVYIEASAFADAQPVEVSEEAPIFCLIPALVQELGLPQTDMAGNRLGYVLRRATDGMLLPEEASLLTTSTQPGTYLTLEASRSGSLPEPGGRSITQHFIVDAALVHRGHSRGLPAHTPAFYAGQTIADASLFVEPGLAFTPSSPEIGRASWWEKL